MKKYNENISYEIVENGYKIYLDEQLWIEQLDEYSKPMDPSKTFEENCIMQLDDITASQLDPTLEQDKIEAQVLYTAMMTDTLLEGDEV